MSTLRVKSIGPISDTGVLQLRKVNVFIGKQSTGKSTLLKILSHCRWVEKLLCVGKPKNGRGVMYAYTHYYRFIQELIQFYRFDVKFFSADSEIIYVGDCYKFFFKGNHQSNVRIEVIPGSSPYNIKLSFIPSERNIVSAIREIATWYRSRELDMLFNFIFEWDEVRAAYSRENALPLVVAPKMEYFYDKNSGEILRLTDTQKEFSPFYASSGVQSALPLEVMVTTLSKTVGTKANLSKSDLMDIVTAILQENQSFNKDTLERSVAANLLTYKGAAFFIEEPEQNLFPESQAQLLYRMVGAIKGADSLGAGRHSMLTIATHSPYILSALNVLMAAADADAIDHERTISVVPESYIMKKGDIGAFCVTESGTVENIIDPEIYMVNGSYLDSVSQNVEDALEKLNEIICQ